MQGKDLDDQGTINMIGEIYRKACNDLISAYRKGNEYRIIAQERWIRANVYGLINDPEAIISACRRMAGGKGYLKLRYKHREK